MNKNQTVLTQGTKREQWMRCCLAALLIVTCLSFATVSGVIPVIAAGGALDGIMQTILDIIGTAALYVGIVIVLWGVFQIIMALRREDSEAIGKQITSVVVGGVLVGFGALSNEIYAALI